MFRNVNYLLRPVLAFLTLSGSVALVCGLAAFNGSPPVDGQADKASQSHFSASGDLSTFTPSEARTATNDWLRRIGKDDADTCRAVDAIWADEDRSVFQDVVETIKLASPEARELLRDAADTKRSAPTEVPLILKDNTVDPFLRANLALAYAKVLSDRRVYEEALDSLNAVKIEKVVDPAQFLFVKATLEYSLCMKRNASATIERLLEDVSDAPERYRNSATVMLLDMRQWKDKDLGWIERKMANIERRLDLARGGQTTQFMEREVVARLDEIIKEKENVRAAGAAPNGALDGWRQGEGRRRLRVEDAVGDMRGAEGQLHILRKEELERRPRFSSTLGQKKTEDDLRNAPTL